MNKQEFISLIEQPETLGKAHITALKQIADDFPYFQSVQILLAKAFYNEHHYEFEKQLKHTSLMVPDRAVLFRYIHNFKEQIAEANITPQELPIPSVELENELQHAELLREEPTSIEEILVEQHIEVIEEIIAEEIEVKEEVVAEVIIPAPIEEPIVQENKTTESHSFAEWLQLQQKHKTPIQTSIIPTSQPIKEEENSIVEPANPEPVVPSASMEEQIAKQVERSNVNEFESILDKFIRENPRITRGKAEFYNPMNMAKQSVEENDDIVTETLANVYYKQGHYKKAIRSYEKLCLIYPHKMTYFASLIQKIKTEIKD